MADGILVNAGTVVAVVHGFSGPASTGQTFVACADVSALSAGQAAPTSVQIGMPATDAGMSRVVEDLVTVLINKGVILRTDLPAAALTKINARRIIRNETTL